MSPHATTAARLATSLVTALSNVMVVMEVDAPACRATTATRVGTWQETALKGPSLATLVGRVVTSAEIVTRNRVSRISSSFHLHLI